MSTRRGAPPKGPPRHQNKTAFKHNKNSKKTAKILANPIEGVCTKCLEILEWKKKYRKYKPRTQPGTCHSCHQKNVTAAYHQICQTCAKAERKCAKCLQTKEIVPSAREVELKEQEEEDQFMQTLNDENLHERDRRRILRQAGIAVGGVPDY